MFKRIWISTVMVFLLSLSTTWGAEDFLGSKLHAATKRLFIGGGAFSDHFCGKKIPKRILIYDINTAEKVGEIQLDTHIKAYDIHPSGRIAVVDDSQSMSIFDADLKLLYKVSEVPAEKESIFFGWNAAGDKLAYMGFHQDVISYMSIYIIDLKTGAKEKIADKANSFRWAKHDGNIYYKVPLDREADGWVYKYDLATKTTTKTKLLGVEFSADGAYYIGSRTEGWEEIPYYLVYDTSDNSEVPDADVDVEKVYELGKYNHFLGNSHKVLTQYGAPVSIFDVDTRKYVRYDMGLGMIGRSDDDSMLVIAEEGCKVRIEDALTGQIMKEFTVDPGN